VKGIKRKYPAAILDECANTTYETVSLTARAKENLLPETHKSSLHINFIKFARASVKDESEIL
jgi:hypothetical protein